MPSIILHDHEARCKDLRYLIRPVKHDPPAGLLEKFPFPKMIGGNLYFQKSEHEQFPCWEFHYEAPWQPGDKLAVRETYGFTEAWGQLVFKAEYPSEQLPNVHCWYGGQTMPLIYARRWLVVESVACKRVLDVTEEEAIGCGAIKHLGHYANDGPGITWHYGFNVESEKYLARAQTPMAAFELLWSKRYSAQWCWIAMVREVRE